MSAPLLVYRHAVNPSRGLAATGIFLIPKLLLALPHLILLNTLNALAVVAGYIGYFVVAFTGQMPGGLYRFIEIAMQWNSRTYGWLIGFTDTYPPFEIDPQYPVAMRMTRPDNPSKGWAVVGIVFLKLLILLPHIVALFIVTVAAIFGVWFGYFAVLFTGRLPVGIQDFAAGVLQWNQRVVAFVAGITDDYPPFRLNAKPGS